MEQIMNSVICPALYFVIGGIVALAQDGHRHIYAESLTGHDTDRARRICRWGWAADMLLWPLYAFDPLCTAAVRLMTMRPEVRA